MKNKTNLEVVERILSSKKKFWRLFTLLIVLAIVAVIGFYTKGLIWNI